MAAKSMPKPLHPLIHKLATNHPQLTFAPAEDFYWSPSRNTVYYAEDLHQREPELLHELAHALLGHTSYTKDIDLLKIEREAWTYAKEVLAQQYDIAIDEDVAEEALDTYRDWLQARSLCPECRSNGLQTKTDTYKCFACGCQWRANDARRCMLRRFKL